MEYEGVEKDSKRQFLTRKRMTYLPHSIAHLVQTIDQFNPSGQPIAIRMRLHLVCLDIEMVDQSDRSIEVTITCIALNTPTTSALNAIDQLISQPYGFFLRQNCTRGALPINYSLGSLMAMRDIALKLSTSISLVHELPSLILDALTLHLHIVECSIDSSFAYCRVQHCLHSSIGCIDHQK